MNTYFINAKLLIEAAMDCQLLQHAVIVEEEHILVYREKGETNEEGYMWEPKWKLIEELMEDEEGIRILCQELKAEGHLPTSFWAPTQCIGCPNHSYIDDCPVCTKDSVCKKPYNV